MRLARILLVGVGALAILLGAWVMFDTVKPKSIWGLLTWLIAAVILHDGIISPIVVGISVGMRRVGRTIPAGVLAIVQAGVLVGCVFTLIVVPEIIRKAKIPKNYTVLPFDYGTRLGLLWIAVAVLTALVVVVYLRTRRRTPAAVTRFADN
ncbi:hypothetical protein GCM10025867_18100 [Frondihabitans sucicola]|uniref:Uncharacterized protein n=1 Tax=Frondihabitans sucicola TaxID=1268041 RepID=A0ABM8GMG6_9MICO|nr:hypothetical protein [Frondihabitans sucicola]BDZ49569.1 hypothetical protein GCM10025867_18100 [Frondihabitans sucicola]